jgi:hypothetical protein
MSRIADEIKFGLEIECGVKMQQANAKGWSQGSYHRGHEVPNTGGWKWETDASLHTVGSQSGRMGEFVSPMLQGEDGMQNVEAMTDELKSVGGFVNRTCGMHINISHPELFKARNLRRLVWLMSRFEEALYAANGTNNRNNGTNRYARSIKNEYKDNGLSNARSMREIANIHRDKFMSLNLQNATSNSPRRRVEFRVFGPSLNPTKIRARLALVMGLVEAAIGRNPAKDWDMIKGSMSHEWADGTHAMYKLINFLGWFPRRGTERQCRMDEATDQAKCEANAVDAMGQFTDTPIEMVERQTQHARALYRLAAKYDATQGQRSWHETSYRARRIRSI